MTQQHGRAYEHELVTGLTDATTSDVWSTTTGYSGNSIADDCDMVVTVSPHLCTSREDAQYNIEAKRCRRGERGKRISNVFSGSREGESGLEELQRFVEGTPSWATPIVALKMSYCKLFVLHGGRLYDGVCMETEWTDGEPALSVLDPQLTPSDNISMRKPTTEQWDSARAAQNDEVELGKSLGLPVTDE